jgi:tol-pal system protein YbgF
MPKPAFAWLMAFLLGGLAPFSVVRAQAPDSSLTLELLQRIEQLEREVRYIRGELELYRHQAELLQRERSTTGQPAQSAASAAIAPPTVAPESEQPAETDQPASAPSATGEQTSGIQPGPAAPDGTEQASFDAALREFGEGRYPQTINNLRQFLQMHPASPLASEAQYWLGESYYVVRDYAAARESFIDLGLRYPNSERLPDALLKLGYIYEMLGDISRAQEVLNKLLQVYPDTQAAGFARQRLLLLR